MQHVFPGAQWSLALLLMLLQLLFSLLLSLNPDAPQSLQLSFLSPLERHRCKHTCLHSLACPVIHSPVLYDLQLVVSPNPVPGLAFLLWSRPSPARSALARVSPRLSPSPPRTFTTLSHPTPFHCLLP